MPRAARHLVFELGAAEGGDPRQPIILRRPEMVHGLRNLIQNAVDFARSTVWIEAEWSDSTITLADHRRRRRLSAAGSGPDRRSLCALAPRRHRI